MPAPFTLSLEDTYGTLWALTAGAPGRSGVWVTGPPDLRTPIKRTARATTRQIGQTVVGWFADAMEGELPLAIRGDDESLWETFRLLQRGLSPFEDSTLIAGIDSAGELTCPIRLTSSLPMPDKKSPATVGIKQVDISVPVWSQDGCWKTPPIRFDATATTGTTITRQFINNGDLDAELAVEWTGSGAWFEMPDPVGRVDLPDTHGRKAVLDCDPAMAAQVTVGGAPSPTLWREMRGRLLPSMATPRSTTTWKFHNCVGVFRERHTTMWRW